jgi:hypothetical protein
MLTEENESIDSQNISTIGDNSCSMDAEQSRRSSEHHEVDNINSVDILSESMFELFVNNRIDRTSILSYLGVDGSQDIHNGGELMVIHEEVIEQEAEIHHTKDELVSIY